MKAAMGMLVTATYVYDCVTDNRSHYITVRKNWPWENVPPSRRVQYSFSFLSFMKPSRHIRNVLTPFAPAPEVILFLILVLPTQAGPCFFLPEYQIGSFLIF